MQTHAGYFLKQRRKSLKISQTKLAKLLGLHTPQQLCNIEKGSCGVPKKYIKKYAKALDMKTNDVVVLMVTDYYNELKQATK